MVDTAALTHLPDTSVEAGAAAENAEERKRLKYSHLDDNFYFVPLKFETFGPFGLSSKSFLSDIGRRITAQTRENV